MVQWYEHWAGNQQLLTSNAGFISTDPLVFSKSFSLSASVSSSVKLGVILKPQGSYEGCGKALKVLVYLNVYNVVLTFIGFQEHRQMCKGKAGLTFQIKHQKVCNKWF